jgi:hypothetical protein
MSDKSSKSLHYFELLSLGALAVGVIVSGLEYKTLAPSPELAFFTLFVQSVVLIFCGGMILLISRKKSNIARWAWAILFIIGLPFYIPALAEMFEAGLAGILSSLQFLMFCAGLYFLFQPDARDALRK